MRILFAATHIGFLRNFESTLALLAERGHRVHIVSDRGQVPDVLDGTPIIERLQARVPGAITTEITGVSKRSAWYAFAIVVRAGLDYWRYLAPEFDDAPKLRARGRENAPWGIVWLSDLWCRTPRGIRVLQSVFAAAERAIPPRREVVRLFDRERWDVVFVTPLLYFGSQQVDYVRVAKRRGIPSVLGVGSWDHLTTKGLIHERPDRVLVWNENQRAEATSLHGIDPACVAVTGAQAYDHWFAMQPSTAREEFCARVGLPADRPYLLYLCSSPFIAPREVEFVRGWARAIRESASPVLRSAGIMVRPHPQNAKQWAQVDLTDCGDAVVWPRAGANPIDLLARREYYDSMHHSHAVVGINTSALIESGIVGRLVYSVRADEFAGTQEGTLHFQHLKNGGLLRMADTLAAHVEQLERSFGSVDQDRAQIRAFIQTFVRPNGLGAAATPLVIDAVEAIAAAGRPMATVPARTQSLRYVLAPLAYSCYVAMSLLRSDRQYWWSVMRHVTRPPRLAARQLRRWSAMLLHTGRRRMVALARGTVRVAKRLVRLPRRLASRLLARTRTLP
jgi:hypothetical protein